ncbi:beta-1,4-glucuronyltransferase 1-like [Tigriopus californicus]|uniref:beta-1,4-glucuronyltransferase 1-like n=1 Tax=Tigriopus californicus TaxID=6832 RepID=UPI0027DA34F8|nr:beta-1,4-glucuronyltransferase 1-like [Tigriopus californicus]
MLSIGPRFSLLIPKKRLTLALVVFTLILLYWNWHTPALQSRVGSRTVQSVTVGPIASIFNQVPARGCTYPRFIFTAQERFLAGGALGGQLGEDDNDDPTARARVGPNPQLQAGANYSVIYNFASPQPNANSFRLVHYDGNDTYTDEPADIEELIDEDHITYVTHATPEFLSTNLIQLLDHWPSAPLSVSVFAPGQDFCAATALISWLWTCEPRVRRQVSFHIIFPSDLANDIAVKTATEGIRILDANCDQAPVLSEETFRSRKLIPYPVNTARNVARSVVRTKYFVTSDIELFPSPNLSANFVKFLSTSAQAHKLLENPEKSPVAFVLPIFEIAKNVPYPKNKAELVKLYNKNESVYFHANFCRHCQRFPGLEEWVQPFKIRKDKKKRAKKIKAGESLTISIAHVSKREPPYDRWEPIYIGTQDDPLYDERLSWEGFQDKMSQMVELCLRNFTFAVLDNAYLIHKPGIKVKTSQDGKLTEPWRISFVERNEQVYQVLLKELADKYGGLGHCKRVEPSTST